MNSEQGVEGSGSSGNLLEFYKQKGAVDFAELYSTNELIVKGREVIRTFYRKHGRSPAIRTKIGELFDPLVWKSRGADAESKVIATLDAWEHCAICVEIGIYDEKIIARMFGNWDVHYKKIKPFVDYFRDRANTPDLFSSFTKYAEKNLTINQSS